MDIGIDNAKFTPITTPLPPSWLGRSDTPTTPPYWANIDMLSNVQVRNLQAQIAYDQSQWNYSKVGAQNQLGRYQFTTQQLENYGLLATGSNNAYGTNCVNYRLCWRQTTVRNSTNSYSNYLYNVKTVNEFLTSTPSQEHLAYQALFDNFTTLKRNNAILPDDTPDTVAGMMYVAWVLGPGAPPTYQNSAGTGAYAWRFANTGLGAQAFNAGRYAITVLSQ